MALFNPTTKRKKNFSWASNGCSILAEIGTLHLEYSELSHYSKNEHYCDCFIPTVHCGSAVIGHKKEHKICFDEKMHIDITNYTQYP